MSDHPRLPETDAEARINLDGAADTHPEQNQEIQAILARWRKKRDQLQLRARWSKDDISAAPTRSTHEHAVDGMVFSQDPLQWRLFPERLRKKP